MKDRKAERMFVLSLLKCFATQLSDTCTTQFAPRDSPLWSKECPCGSLLPQVTCATQAFLL